MSYKVLILIDNSEAMGQGNLSVAREIAKYIVSNSNENIEYGIGTLSGGLSIISEYGCSSPENINVLDKINLSDGNTRITDTLIEVLEEWRESDFALRGVVVFSAENGDEINEHSNEELYYLLGDTEYPVITVGCMKEGSRTGKHLTAISTLSGAKNYFTEFDGSEAAVEVTIGEEIINEISDCQEEYNSDVFSETYSVDTEEAYGSLYYEGQVYELAEDRFTEEACEDEEDRYLQEACEVSSENSSGTLDAAGGDILPLIIPSLVMVLVTLIIITVIIVKRGDKDEETEENPLFDAYDNNRKDYGSSYTRALNLACHETVLLNQSAMSHDITLEDCHDPTRLFRASCVSSIIVGRAQNTCDIVIDYDDSISGRHCEILFGHGEWFVRDLDSLNGTRVNQRNVYQEMEIHSGDILQLGRLSLNVNLN